MLKGSNLRDEAIRLTLKHHDQIRKSINLVASENISSPAVKLALASDLIQRYSSHKHYKSYGELEERVSEIFRSLLHADYADITPISGLLANLVSYITLTNIGDRYMALKSSHGGHHSYMEWGLAGVRNLRFNPIPFDENSMTIDIDNTVKDMEKVNPKMIILGGTVILFPQPTKEITTVAKEKNIGVMYDAAHVFGLTVAGVFPNPMLGGVDIMTTSTHKTFPGPQGGAVFSTAEFGSKVRNILSTVVANPHPNRIPALAIALAEMLAFGRDYASQIVANAKSLAAALHEKGISVLGEERGFTETHQVVIDVSRDISGKEAVDTLARSGILCTATKIPKDEDSDMKSGLRLGTAEVTRLGMRRSEMVEIADYIKKVIAEGRDVQEDVANIKESFRSVKYCFEEENDAYEFILSTQPYR